MSKTGSRINKIIIFALTLTIVILIVERFTNKSVHVLDYGEKGIAVLAFADMSPNKDHEYFSDGISEELLNILVKIPDLKVISRTSSFSYKDKNATAIQIGKELNVSHILEGSIRKAGNMVRITAQLIKTSDGSHEWSHTFDRNMDSIFKIQDEIANEVSKQLELSIMDKPLDYQKTPDIEAYNLYLQARHLIRLNNKDSYLLAEELMRAGIDFDIDHLNAQLGAGFPLKQVKAELIFAAQVQNGANAQIMQCCQPRGRWLIAAPNARSDFFLVGPQPPQNPVVGQIEMPPRRAPRFGRRNIRAKRARKAAFSLVDALEKGA